jgi:Zn-dependent protease/CBS domain-containing protein
MRSHIKLGRVFGITIGLHYSWFLIAVLIVLSLSQVFRVANSAWAPSFVLTLAILSGLLFFVSLLLHELAHSLLARSVGIPVREITLFALGGVSNIEETPASAKSEFWIAFAGPLTSAVLGFIFMVIGNIAEPMSATAVAASWLAYINFGLALFNLVPGYPLDGGRILRAGIWWKTGDMDRATRYASRTGQAVGVGFIALGMFEFFAGAGFGGLWIAFIGWFLLQAAGASYLEIGISRALAGVTVADAMTTECAALDGNMSVERFVDEILLRTRTRCFAIHDNDGFAGLVTLNEVKGVDRARWPYTRLYDIMRPLDQVQTVDPATPLKKALEIMGKLDLNQLPVVIRGKIAGILSRSEVLNYLHTRLQLQG